MATARRSYGQVLRLATAALGDGTEALKDKVLLSVLLLSTYELVSGTAPHPTDAWQKHVTGAAALAYLGQAAQFETRAGREMFQNDLR
ncbi:hypothetical protein MY11210_006148 [Beauveria gryllotalpidicola]